MQSSFIPPLGTYFRIWRGEAVWCQSCCPQWKEARRIPCMSMSRRNAVSILLICWMGVGEMAAASPERELSLPFRKNREPPDVRGRLGKHAPGRPTSVKFIRDLFYPAYCVGTWQVISTLLSVSAPAGYSLFGPRGAFEEVEKVRSTLSIHSLMDKPARSDAEYSFNRSVLHDQCS